jgi:chemotaxis protein MotB
MSRKQRHPEHENHERWLISYADFITLLFAFFVVMFASSQTDKNKAQQVSDSVNSALNNGAIKPRARTAKKTFVPPNQVEVTDLTPSMKFLNQSLANEKVEVHIEARGLVVSLRQSAFFPSGDDEVAPQSYATLEKIATMLSGMPNPIRLEGHTDSVPIHSIRFRSNWELSAARSIAMLEVLSGRFGIPSDRFGISGYADTTPVDTNETEEGRTHNRRVDIAVLNQKVVVKNDAVSKTPPLPSPAPHK